MTFKKPPLYAQILIAMVAGMAIGAIFGGSAAPLGEFGKIIIQLIKMLAAPLLFFAILDAFLRTEVRLKSAATMIMITGTNMILAVLIGLGLANFLQPGRFLSVPKNAETVAVPQGLLTVGKMDFVKTLTGYIPESLLKPFVENTIISIILIAVLLGLAMRRMKNENVAAGKTEHVAIEAFVAGIFRAFEILLSWVILLLPLAVFGVVAKVTGEQGFVPFLGLASYFGVVLLGLILHVGLVYHSWIVFGAGLSIREFWRGAKDAVVYAMGASSSLATLPVTLKSLDKMGVSPQSARMAACVGTNLNNDGIILYEALAVIFVAQAYGIVLTPYQQIIAAAACVLAGVGIAGVPEAGLISLSLALATVGLPVEILPLLLTVDWVLGRARAMTNVTSDILVAVLLDRREKKGVPNLLRNARC